MSDFSGEHGFFPDWFWPAVSLLVVAPTALALFMARPWWVGLAMLAAATGVAVLGWWGWGWGAGVANRSGASPRRRRVRAGIDD